MRQRHLWVLLLLGSLAVELVALTSVSSARVGGGQSYSDGSSSSSSGRRSSSRSKGGSFQSFIVFVVVIFAVGFLSDKFSGGKARASSAASALDRSPTSDRSATAAGIRKLQAADPNFSVHPFLDFVQLLYTRVQETMGRGSIEPLSAYLSRSVLEAFEAWRKANGASVKAIENVIVGATQILAVRHLKNGFSTIEVEIEANFTEIRAAEAGERRQDFYSRERWTFAKHRDTLSKPPETIAALGCPSCGASGDLTLQGQCSHCGQAVNIGRFHWMVDSIEVLKRREKEPMQPSGSSGVVVEAGTELPTVVDPELKERRRVLDEDPDFTWDRFEQLVRRYFTELQAAWTAMQWERSRPFETDHLFETHRFWIECYRQSGLNNCVEDVTVHQVVLAKIQQDAFFDAVTVRIYASALDYTVDREGCVVEGSREQRRRFSEYWTLIRRRKGQRRPVAEARQQDSAYSCPSCGAPITLTQTAICQYCGAKVASGEFDWVVSLIEQDEAYSG